MKKVLFFLAILTLNAIAGGRSYENGSRCIYEYAPIAPIYPIYDDTAAYYDNLGVQYHNRGQYADAIFLHYEACKMGYAPACNHAGFMYDSGQAVAKNHKTARKYFDMACKYGSSVGCLNLGIIYEYGEGTKRDVEKALEYYKKSCNMGLKESCRDRDILWTYILWTK